MIGGMTGPELKEWMKRNGWTARTFALKVGVSEVTVWRWRSREGEIPTLVQLAIHAVGHGSWVREDRDG